MHRILILLLTVALVPLSWGQDPFDEPAFLQKGTTAKVVPESTVVEKDSYFEVAFVLDLQSHYHAYYKNPGSIGSPPSVEWELPEGLTAGSLLFPRPEAIRSSATGAETVLYGYEGKVTFLARVDVDADLELGKDFEIKGTFYWQECQAICLQGEKEFSFKVKIGDEPVFLEDYEELFQAARETLPQDASAWAFSASEKENRIKLEVNYPEALDIREPVYFFSDDNQVDAQASQEVSIEGGKIVISMDRNLGNKELAIPEGPVKDTLSGLLVFNDEGETSSAEFSVPFTADAQGGAEEVILSFVPATEEDRKTGAELYDVDARPDVVGLDGVKEKQLAFFTGLGLLFLGGLLLNLMPCVFPVLGLKVMGFVAQAGEDEKKIKVHGMVFGLGLLIAMWILAAFVISLGISWGDQLNKPIFLGAMIIFFILMGLNLYGVFELGTKLTGVGGDLQAKKGYSGSFFSGVLTTLVATPCSGPFLGGAMAFALALDPPQAFVAFTVFGLGIASPYILLSFFPALIKKLPRPGPWMVSFKQIMSFLLFATAIFFMRAFNLLVGESHFNFFLFAILLISLGAYLYGRWGTPTVSKVKRMITGYSLAGLMVFGGMAWAFSNAKFPEEEGRVAWHEWYPGIFERGRNEGRIVWVDYTAET